MTKIFFFMSLLSANIYAKPNIILIFVDDLGYCDSEIYGCEEIKTPNIKKLADSGVSFSAGYVTSPVCSTSRASLLTGKFVIEDTMEVTIPIPADGPSFGVAPSGT